MSENPFQVQVDDIEMPEFDDPPPIPKISTPPIIQTPDPIPSLDSYPKINTSSITSEEKRAKLEALRAREAELLAKKQRLDETTIDLQPTSNWPSFFPLIHYDPQNDLSAGAQPCIQSALYSLIALVGSVFFNSLTVLCVSGLKEYQKTRCFIFSVIQGFAAVYLSYNYSFVGLYNACKKRDIPFKWTIIQFVVIAWLGYLAVGFPTSGSVGFATMLDIFAKSKSGFSKFMSLINTAITGGALFLSFRTLQQAQAYQKVSGTESPLLAPGAQQA